MNRYLVSSLLAIAAAAVTTTARADDITVDTTPFTSTKTRAEVQAELAAFQQSGVNPWSQAHDQLAGFRSTRSRAEVTADYIANRDEVAATTGEDSGSAALAQAAPAASSNLFAGQPSRAQ